MIPARPILGMIPVRRPAEVGGIDVGRQPLFEPVQLVRPAKMHLSRQDGSIAAKPQAMRESRDVGAETPPHCRRRRLRDGSRPDMKEARDGEHRGLLQ